uniref:F-box associated beta-propeller type 1 domain-containing protein n=1 Tax=Kalanchoe fedtschenkoi TaxID=63787 RepID=A0A7N0UDK5_KALFE
MEVELPKDLIRLILVKIPEVKFLVRLKLVSKSWKVVICSSRFAAEHHAKHYYYCGGVVGGSSNNKFLSSFLVVRTCPNPEVVDFFTLISMDKRTDTMNYISEKKNIYMPYLDCRNEVTYPTTLAIDAGFGVYCLFEFNTNRVALWNPSMRELKVLPPSPFYSVIETTYPDLRQHVYGFGHVGQHRNDDDGSFSYKVARLIIRRGPEQFQYFSMELYSSTTNAWKLLSDCYRVEYYGITQRRNSEWFVEGTNLNGRFHWLAWFSTQDPHIIWFDYNTEEFGRIEVPGVVLEGRYNVAGSHITIFDHRFICLVLNRTTRKRRRFYLEVWVLREYGMGKSWTKEECMVGPIPGDMRLKGYWNSIQRLFLRDIDKRNRLYLCDCQSSRIENLGIGSDEWEEMMVLPYTESLVSLNGNSDETRTES